MTSMLLIDRYDFATSGAAVVAVSVAAVMEWNRAACRQTQLLTARERGGHPQHYPHPNPLPQACRGLRGSNAGRSGFLAAVARSDVLFLGIRSRGLLDHRPHQFAIRLDPIGDHLPLVAVPLQELHRAASFVVHARHLERLHEARCAELLEACVADLQVLDAPADLLAGQRLLAVFLLRLADRLDGNDAVHHTAVVVDAADPRLIFHLTLALGVDVLLDVLYHREVSARYIEAVCAVPHCRAATSNLVH